jgi:hypothetical protein
MRKHRRISASLNAPRIATKTIRLVAKIPHAKINARQGIIASWLARLDGGEAASVGGFARAKIRHLAGKLDVLAVTCEKCGRAGRYRVTTLPETVGWDGKLTDWLHGVTRDCPRKQSPGLSELCGARYPQLPFWNGPFWSRQELALWVDGHREENSPCRQIRLLLCQNRNARSAERRRSLPATFPASVIGQPIAFSTARLVRR